MHSQVDSKASQKHNSRNEIKKKYPTLYCPFDFNAMGCNNVYTVQLDIKKKVRIYKMPTYKCPVCNKEYAIIKDYPDFYNIYFKGKQYLNLSIDVNSNQIKIPKKIVYKPYKKVWDKETQQNIVTIPDNLKKRKCYIIKSLPKQCVLCNETLRNATFVKCINSTEMRYKVKLCYRCMVYYIPYTLYDNIKTDKVFDYANPEDAAKYLEEDNKRKLALENERLKAAARNQTDEKIVIQKDQKTRRTVEKATKVKSKKQRKLEEAEERRKAILNEYLNIDKHKNWENLQAIYDEKLRIEKEILRAYDADIEEYKKRAGSSIDSEIGVKDFVVRKSTFKCAHKEHELKNIDAKVDIIDIDGKCRQLTVAAGYCAKCNVYFILDSTYQYLKSRGVPVCQIVDFDKYLVSEHSNSKMQLAGESILMQHGYNVSQQNGLSAASRQGILSLLIDNKITTREEIISYLDFFINQRKSISSFKYAISKWEEDRCYVEKYKIGSYSTVKINSIIKK